MELEIEYPNVRGFEDSTHTRTHTNTYSTPILTLTQPEIKSNKSSLMTLRTIYIPNLQIQKATEFERANAH